MTAVHDIPVLVGGRQREPGIDPIEIAYADGPTVRLYRPTIDDARAMLSTDPSPLRDLPFDDITIFFTHVRDRWLDPDNHWRRLALELGPRVTGYADHVVRSDVDYLGHTLARQKQYDFVETDLGDPYLLDEWRPDRAVYHRCWPKGIVAHVMVGNVPLASLFALYRSLVTKNITIAKVPSRDVVAALAFANCIYETAPDHPVARALSCLYWPAGSDVEHAIIEGADVLSVWGRGETVEALKAKVPQGREIIEFGPKRSMGVVLPEAGSSRELGARLAFDAVMYDQEACFSLQEVFVAERAEELAQAIAHALACYESTIPRRALSIDQQAHIQRARLEAQADGWQVFAPDDTSWTVVLTDAPTTLQEHPLARFVYVHPFDDLADVLRRIDRDTQTVSLAPWSSLWAVADRFTAAGADRIVPTGRMTRFRPGLTHDGFRPMARMVRWVSVERDISFKYKFTDVAKDVYDARLYGVALDPQPSDGEVGGERDLEPAIAGGIP
jgi:long-chain-fatty-acyl-CoA reductase